MPSHFITTIVMALAFFVQTTFLAAQEREQSMKEEEGSFESIFEYGSTINLDEEITFFTSIGYWQEERQEWRLKIHGWVYEPEHDSRKRKLLIQTFQKILGEKVSEKQNLAERLRPFLVDNEGGETVQVTIANQVCELLLPSDGGGHFSGEVALSSQQLAEIFNTQQFAYRWLIYQAVLPKGDNRTFQGQVQLIPPQGLSIISDIDDTLKISGVYLDKTVLLENTFLKEPQACPGMVSRYQNWQQQQQASFHYVSGSPWQLYSYLEKFLQTAGYPKGSLHLKKFRLNPFSSEFFNLFGHSATMTQKLSHMEEILKAYPKRQFYMVGDSGEKDPEIYAHLLQKYPKQIQQIWIRNVTKESYDNNRFRQAFGKNISKVHLLDPDSGEIQPFSATSASENAQEE